VAESIKHMAAERDSFKDERDALNEANRRLQQREAELSAADSDKASQLETATRRVRGLEQQMRELEHLSRELQDAEKSRSQRRVRDLEAELLGKQSACVRAAEEAVRAGAQSTCFTGTTPRILTQKVQARR
jgi:chromosome segregation ATPase